MMTRLIFARHGNTFGPHDTPVWVGARTDLPLVDKGLTQSAEVARALQEVGILPHTLIAGPLKRTRQMADIIAEILSLSPTMLRIDPRLTEIDYGAWEGKSTPEIEAMGGSGELAAWNKSSHFPLTPGWSPREDQIIANTKAILAESVGGTSLIVTSNGILRFFARLAHNGHSFPDRKVATGHLCIMERDTKDWRIIQWNLPPAKMSAALSS